MHYLITQLHKTKPELLELPQELQAVSKSSESKFGSVDLKIICSSIFII